MANIGSLCRLDLLVRALIGAACVVVGLLVLGPLFGILPVVGDATPVVWLAGIMLAPASFVLSIVWYKRVRTRHAMAWVLFSGVLVAILSLLMALFATLHGV